MSYALEQQMGYGDDEGIGRWLHGLGSELPYNYAHLQNPVAAMMPTLVNHGGQIEPGIGFAAKQAALPEDMRRYADAQQVAAMQMAGPWGEQARARVSRSPMMNALSIYEALMGS